MWFRVGVSLVDTQAPVIEQGNHKGAPTPTKLIHAPAVLSCFNVEGRGDFLSRRAPNRSDTAVFGHPIPFQRAVRGPAERGADPAVMKTEIQDRLDEAEIEVMEARILQL